MALARGIKGIKRAEEQAQQAVANRVNWLKLEDGQTVKLRFIGEWDEDAPGYTEDRAPLSVLEHQRPDDFKKKARCTLDTEGRCWACEQAATDKKWRAKERFYTNVLVDDGMNDPTVRVWHMSPYKNQNYEILMEHASDNDTMLGQVWRYKRKGKTQNDTTYIMTNGGVDKDEIDVSKYEPYDLMKAIPEIPYEDQAKFYGPVMAPVSAAESHEESSDGEIVW